MAEQTSILGFRSPRRRRKALLGVAVVVFGVFIYLIYLMASGPDEERAALHIVESAIAGLPNDRLSVSDIGKAAEALQRALHAHPMSVAALEAMSSLQQRISGQVVADIEEGDLDAANDALEEAAKWWPDDGELSEEGSLHAELRSALERRALIDEAAELVTAAARRLSGGSTGNSAIAEALQLLSRALELDPGNTPATALRDDIRRDVEAAVQDALSLGEAERAGRLLDAVEEEWSEDSDLAELRGTVAGRLEELAKAVEISRLLDLAQQRFRDDRLMTPARDSAAHYYRRVLQSDPNNESARAGLERIGERYVVLIRGALDDEALSRARRLLRSLQALLPGHPRIAPLGMEIEAAERAIAAAAVADAEPERPAAVEPTTGAVVDSPTPAAVQMPSDDEGRLWYEIKDSCVDAELRRYIESYPAGRYIEEAWRKISSCIESR